MDQPGFLHRGLRPAGLGLSVALLALALGACGGDSDPELPVADPEAVIYGDGTGAVSGTTPLPAERGTIEGRVIFKGTLPRKSLEDISKEFCVAAWPQGMPKNDIVVDPENRGLQWVFVKLSKGFEKYRIPPPPSEPVVMDQQNCRYVPHVAILRVKQRLIFKTSDDTLHNVHYKPAGGKEENFAQNTAGKRDEVPPITREQFLKVKCDVHGWMEGFLAVVRHPWAALSAKDGSFKIEGVPPGEYTLLAQHEKLKTREMTVTVEANKTAQVTIEYSR